MNRVQLIGMLVCPVELRTLRIGRTFGKTIIAVPRGIELGTDWVTLTLWDRQAVNAARYLNEGARVAIEGRIHGTYRVTKADDGSKRTRRSVEVIVERIAYLSPRPPAGVAGDRR
jgi:single-stranded DNA-binding protein